MILNMSAQKKFDCSIIDSIPLIQKYPIWKKKDPFGREYYGVSNFWGMDANIKEDSDLSWLEWDGNEINIDSKVGNEIMPLFRETVGIFRINCHRFMPHAYIPTVFYHLFFGI